MKNKNEVKYISTRGSKHSLSSSECIAKGIAEDGGLFVPDHFPEINFTINKLKDMSYIELAYEILSIFLTDFSESELRDCIEKAYGQGFDDPLIAPLKQVEDFYFLELFHGKTLAFKDMALSILPHLMMTAANKIGINKKVAVLTATSGDTGKAALSGFANVENTEVIVFYPIGGVSEVQQLQMLTQEGENTHVVGIYGNFDDAQNGVKNIFTDTLFNNELSKKGFLLSSANSINIGRLLPQVVYYFYSYGQLLNKGDITEGEKINFVVPTGNFGNILAGYYAKKLGLPINDLVCASNMNKVLYDFFETGTYNKKRDFVLTISPSMDILISSNLERLLYDVSGYENGIVRDCMERLSETGSYSFDCKNKGIIPSYATEKETFEAIKEVYDKGYVMDTHTAVAYAAYKKTVCGNGVKSVIVSTASPYKFCDNVLHGITGNDYRAKKPNEMFSELSEISKVPVPSSIDGLEKREILHKMKCDRSDMKETVKQILINI